MSSESPRQGLLELMTPLEQRTLVGEIASYYSEVAAEELAAARIPDEREFIMVRRKWLLRRLTEVVIGTTCSLAGFNLWVLFSSSFIKG